MIANSVADYNLGQVVFLVSFLMAELPSQLVSKKVGPDRWIPIQIVLWSLVAITQCSLKGRTDYLATRALLGLLEGGFIADIVLWLSYFYTSRELPIRLRFAYQLLFFRPLSNGQQLLLDNSVVDNHHYLAPGLCHSPPRRRQRMGRLAVAVSP